MINGVSSYDVFLRDHYDPVAMKEAFQGPFMERLKRDLDERERQDIAYLGSLGEHARRVELTRRRIAKAEARFRAALDFSPCDCDDEW